jgi:hypothetical protein
MNQIRELQKLKMLEVLWEIYKGGRTRREWIEGEIPSWDESRKDRKEATRYLLQIDFIEEDTGYPERLHPHPFCLTAGGRAFLENVRARIGGSDNINWQRLNEIEFPSPGEQT